MKKPYYEKELKIAIEIGVWDCCPVSGDYGKAIKYDEKCLKIAKEMGYKAGEGAFTKLVFSSFQSLRSFRTLAFI